MAIVFFYYTNIFYWTASIISAGILIIVNLLIIKSGRNQPEGVEGSNLLVVAGIINIIINITMFFIPILDFFKLTQNEYHFYKIYYLSVQLIVPISSLITYGICLTNFGRKNRDKYEKLLLTAGISMTIGYIIQIITVFFYVNFLIDYYIYYPGFSIEGDLMWTIYLVLINFPITAYLFGVLLFVLHGKMNKDKYFHYSGLLMIIQFIWMTNLYWILGIILGAYF